MTARKIREEINEKENNNNNKFCGSYSMQKKGIAQSRSINEVTRVIDAKVKEREYVENKFECNKDSIDAEAKNAFQNKKVTASIIKCAHGHNHYGVRNAKINNNMVDESCPRCD